MIKDLVKVVFIVGISMCVSILAMWSMDIISTSLFDILLLVESFMLASTATVDARLIGKYYNDSLNINIIEMIGLIEDTGRKMINIGFSLYFAFVVSLFIYTILTSTPTEKSVTVLYAVTYVMMGLVVYVVLRRRVRIRGLEK